MRRWKRLVRLRWLLVAAAVVAAGAGAWWYWGRATRLVLTEDAEPVRASAKEWYRAHGTPEVLTVSKPRTIAVHREPADGQPYKIWWCYWLDDSTLIAHVSFRCWSEEAGERIEDSIWGIVRVDTRTGAAAMVHVPRLAGAPAATGDLPCEGDLYYGPPLPSPTGDQIAYSVSVKGRPDANGREDAPETGFWISRADGSQAKRVVPWCALPLAWSHDGRLLAFSRTYSGDPGLWVCQSDGRGLRKIASEFRSTACFSPDSRELAYTMVDQGDLNLLWLAALGPGCAKTLVDKRAHAPIWVDGALLCLKWETVEGRRLARWPRLRKLSRLPAPRRKRVPCLAAVDPITHRKTTLERLDARPSAGSPWLAAPARGKGVFLLLRHHLFLIRPGGIAARPDRHTGAEVCALTTDGLQRVPLEPDIEPPSWSPSGKRLVYIKDGQIKVVDVSLKTPRGR